MIRNEKAQMSIRKFFAIVYRSEQKRILINQIKLVKVTLHIIERLMKGMTLDFAVTRIFELESKQDVVINRRMIHSYLESLQKGLEKNKQEYLKINNITLNELQAVHAEKRFEEFVSRAEMKQFEMKGYDQMIARILDAPLKSSEQNNNSELSQKLSIIKNQLFSQPAAIRGKENDDGKKLAQSMRTYPENLMD